MGIALGYIYRSFLQSNLWVQKHRVQQPCNQKAVVLCLLYLLGRMEGVTRVGGYYKVTREAMIANLLPIQGWLRLRAMNSR